MSWLNDAATIAQWIADRPQQAVYGAGANGATDFGNKLLALDKAPGWSNASDLTKVPYAIGQSVPAAIKGAWGGWTGQGPEWRAESFVDSPHAAALLDYISNPMSATPYTAAAPVNRLWGQAQEMGRLRMPGPSWQTLDDQARLPEYGGVDAIAGRWK